MLKNIFNEKQIKLKDGTIITYEPHWCENNEAYADFTQLADTTFEGDDIDINTLRIVPNYGITLGGHFIPCYKKTLGYYDCNLILVITSPNKETNKIDCSSSCYNKIADVDDIFH